MTIMMKLYICIHYVQVAGCALDASAKIYAGRVDSIYTDALKVLGGLNKGSEDRCSDTGTVYAYILN